MKDQALIDDPEFWDAWLAIMIAMHDQGFTNYPQFMWSIAQEWEDLRRQSQMVELGAQLGEGIRLRYRT